METLGILCVSHSKDLVEGLRLLIDQVAKEVAIAYVGGLNDDEIGTSFDAILLAVESLKADRILTFFDLGSARMNVEMVLDFSDKDILIQQVAFVEGAYTAAALLQAGASEEEILEQLDELEIRK